MPPIVPGVNRNEDVMNTVESATRPRLLMVDDDASLLRQLTWGLKDQFDVSTAGTVTSVFTAARAVNGPAARRRSKPEPAP